MGPIIGMTIGDVSGVGPEVCVKALQKQEIWEISRPLMIGDAKAIERIAKVLGVAAPVRAVASVADARFDHGILEVLQATDVDLTTIPWGQVNAEAGKASVQFIEKAIALAKSGEIAAIAAAPINKEAINQAGCPYPGHTEMLAALTDTKDYAMMLVADKLRVLHVTTHVSMRRACDLITTERVLKVIRLASRAAQELGSPQPKVAVAGLNAHAGEGGLFGKEETEAITPAVEAARKEGIDTYGPLPPDTVFLRASRGQFDVAVAMYHDQGHIPVKMLGFEAGVNATVGLPIIRTSVDHGTGFGRAGQGRADESSMVEAIKLAVMMAAARKGDKTRSSLYD